MTTTALTPRRRAGDPADAAQFSMLPAIDDAIARFGGRSIVATSEVIDLLLDLRLTATTVEIVTLPE